MEKLEKAYVDVESDDDEDFIGDLPKKEIQAEDWIDNFNFLKGGLEDSIFKVGTLLIKDYVFLQPTDKWSNEDLNKLVLKFQSETNGTLPIWEDELKTKVVGYYTNLKKYENFKGKGPSVVGDIYLFKEVESPFFSACFVVPAFFNRNEAALKGAQIADDVLTPLYKDKVIAHLLTKIKNLKEKDTCKKEESICQGRKSRNL